MDLFKLVFYFFSLNALYVLAFVVLVCELIVYRSF